MGYYMRFITTDEQTRAIHELHAELHSHNSKWSLHEHPATTRPGADIVFDGSVYGELEVNRPGDGLFEEEIGELQEFLEDAGEGDLHRVSTLLNQARAIIAVRVLWGGREADETLDTLQVFWEALSAHHTGLLQADGEGYYDDSGLILSVE